MLDCHNIYQHLAVTLSIKAQNSALARAAMETRDASDSKEHCRVVHDSQRDIWDMHAAQVLSDGLQIKFSDPVLRDRLMETQHRHLEVCKLPQQDKDVLHLDNLFRSYNPSIGNSE